MRVQRICRRLVLLLLAAACLCQMALAVDPAFRYGSKNVSWVEMDGDDFLLLDGDETDRDHPIRRRLDEGKPSDAHQHWKGRFAGSSRRSLRAGVFIRGAQVAVYHVRLFCQLQDVRFFL